MASKLLVVIGCLEDEDHIKKVVKNVEAGVEKWISPMHLGDQEEIIHILNTIPSMKSIPNRNAQDGTVVSRYRGRILDSTVLISPTSENLNGELIDLFLTAPPRCLIAYGGFVTEDNADWILQDGLFSLNSFRQALEDSKVATALSQHNTKVTISCCKLGLWKTTEQVFTAESKIALEIMDSQPLLELNGGGDHSSGTHEKKQSKFEEFSSFLEDGIGNEIGGIFNTLKPPLQEGFLKIRHPCLYIFPGGSGDSAFFAVNGFNMLVNGGSCTKPWFWKLIQHLDRVDSILATHLGSDNLPGLNSLLLRKLQERQVKLPMDSTTPEYQEMKRCLISPDLGPIFMNPPKKFLESVSKSSEPQKTNGTSPNSNDGSEKRPIQKSVDVVKDTMRLSKALNMEMVPLARKSSSIEPVTLFSKVGLGHLEMYVISPSEGSKELAYVNDKWGCNGKTSTPTGKTGPSAGHEGDSVTNLSSICALLVWHPSNPNEKIVRVLFPGNAPQAKIFEGLESLKNLPFLKAQYVTKNILNKQKHSSKPNGTHATQKPARPVNAANLGKKPTSAATTRKVVSVPAKKEAPAKLAEKRPKTDRPASTKAKSASSASASKTATKERATTKAVKTEPEKPSKLTTSTAKKPASSRSAPATKAESKRPSSSVASKTAPKSKTTTAATTKVLEKTKKPQTLAASKPKSEPHKATPKRSTKPPAKKATPISKLGNKAAKKEKASPAKEAPTPPEDLTADFAKFEEGKEKEPSKPAELLSVGSEEPTTSVLSDRHSPEGEDGSTVQYAESPSLTQNEKSMPEKDDERQPQEQEDTGFVIMNKQEIISEDSDMISTNGSSAAAQQQTPIEDVLLPEQVQNEEELISSDKSTPEEDHVDQQEIEKAITFSEPEVNESQVHKPVERLPTPFHSLQDSSVISETSPISESENAPTESAVLHQSSQQEIEIEIPADAEKEKVADADSMVDDIESAKPVDNMPEEAQEDLSNVMPNEENVAEVREDDTAEPMPAEKIAPEPTEKNFSEPPKEIGSEVHSSFNSSIEGSYELYPVERSPPPASAQETIAETISDFKHDDPPAAEDLQEPSTYMDTQPQQVEMFEDPTMSTEAPDARYSMSTTSTGSQFARIEPPFSSSDAGLSSVAIDQSVAVQQDHVEAHKTEETVNQDEMPEVDQDVTPVVEKFDNEAEHSEAEDDVVVENLKENQDQFGQDEAKEMETELLVVDEEHADDVEDADMASKGPEPETENYPRQAWSTHDEREYEDNDEYSEEKEVQEEKEMREDAEEMVVEEDSHVHDLQPDRDIEDVITQEEHDMHIIPNTEKVQSSDNPCLGDLAGEVADAQVKEDSPQEHIEMTGSLASSAQDQESEPTSMTENADLSEAEQHPEGGFVDDGPDLKDYENVDTGAIPKSDLMLASMEDHFTLHGGTAAEQDLLGFNDEPEQKQSSPETNTHGSAQPTDLWLQQEDVPVAAPRYHPAYLDPSAPLADTEEVQTGIDQLKAAELDSPLDVHAKPFIPKSSMPLDPSPTCGAEAQFGSDDAFPDDDAFKATAPVSPPNTNNPFLVDLMSNNQQNLFDTENPCLPPNRGSDPCAAQDKTNKSTVKKTGSGSTSSGKSAASPIYLDLAYVPNHGNKRSVGKEFFQKIRAKYYVISGNDETRDEPSAEVLDHLLEGRRSWFSEQTPSTSDSEDTNVTVIPTHDSQTLREWYKQNFKELESCNIHMVASGSKVMVQVESIEACKIEF